MSQPRRSTRSAVASRAATAAPPANPEPRHPTLLNFLVRRGSTRSGLLSQKIKQTAAEAPRGQDESNIRKKEFKLRPDTTGADALSPIKPSASSTSSSRINELPSETLKANVSRGSLQKKFAHLLQRASDKKESVQKTPEKASEAPRTQVPLTPSRHALSIATKTALYSLPHLDDLGSNGKKLRTSLSATSSPRRDDSAARHMSYSPYLRVPMDLRIKLPDDFETIDQIFDGLESTVCFNLQKGEIPVFHRIQHTVQLVCSRTFELSHLASICAVFPEAYIINALKVAHKGAHVKSYSIEYNHAWRNGRKRRYDNDDEESNFSQSSKEAKTEKSSTPDAHQTDTADRGCSSNAPYIPALDMNNRRREFRTRLINIIDDAHKVFLAKEELSWSPRNCKEQTATPTSTPKINAQEDFSGEKVYGDRWHPRFDPSFAKVPTIELPAFKTGEIGPSDAELSIKLHMEARRQPLSTPKTLGGSLNSPLMMMKSSPALNSSSSADRFSSLALRIREKEKKLAEAKKVALSQTDIDRLTMLSRLPVVALSVQSIFHHSNKLSLPLAKVAQGVSDSYPNPLGVEEASCHLKLLGEVTPEFCSVIDVGASKYMRLRASATLTSVRQAVEAARISIEQSKTR